jgi:hypothetical protein
MKKDPRGSFFFLAPQVGGRDAESLLGELGLIGQLKRQLAESACSALWRPGFQHHFHSHQNGFKAMRRDGGARAVNTLNASVLALAEKKKARAKSDLYEMVGRGRPNNCPKAA